MSETNVEIVLTLWLNGFLYPHESTNEYYATSASLLPCNYRIHRRGYPQIKFVSALLRSLFLQHDS